MSRKTLAKNAGAMIGSQIITWSFAFLYAIFIPRYLGPEVVGQMSLAFAIWTILGVLLNFGMDTYLIKTIAREPERTGELVGTSILVRCLLFIPGCVLVALYVYLLRYPIEVAYLCIIIGISTLFGLVGNVPAAALTGLERMSSVSLINIIDRFIVTGLSLLLLFLGFNVYWLAAVNIVSSLIRLIIQIRYLSHTHPIRVSFHFKEIYAMVGQSSPYLITGITIMVYQQIDKLFISTQATIEAVGWYSTAMNLFGTLMFLPVAFGTVLFPIMSRSYAAGNDQLAVVARRSFDLMFMLSVPIGFGVIIVADPMMLLLYGPAFAPSGQILAILGLVLLFTYMNTMLGQLLISAERTKPWNVVLISATLLTAPLDLFLVPWTHRVYGNGALGGAIAFTVTELIMISSAILLLPKGTLRWSNLRTVVLSLLSGLIMVGVSWWWRDSYLILSILLGAITYPALVLLLRIIPQEDLLLLKEGFTKILGRFQRDKQATAGLGGD